MSKTTTVTISVRGIEILALKKLSLCSHAIATKLDYRAATEMTALATTLDDVIRQIEIKGATLPSPSTQEAGE